MSLYPATLPIAEGLELVSIIRSNQLSTKKAKAAYNLWLLQGFAQKTLVGDPDATAVTDTTGIVLTPQAVDPSFDAVGALEKLCLAEQDGVTAQLTVPWKQLLQWAITELGTLLLAA